MTPEEFARAYADSLPAPSASQLRAQVRRLLERVAQGQRLGVRYLPIFAAALLLGIVLLVTLTGKVARDASLAAHELPAPRVIAARLAGSPVIIGAPMVGGDDAAGSELAFADGTRFTLEAKSEARLEALASDGVKLALQRGRLEARVRKGTGITWTLTAGPYAVRVIGTEFTLAYEPESARIEVEVKEGRVRVHGGSIAEPGMLLDRGGHFESERLEPALSATPPLADGAVTVTAQARTLEPVPARPTARDDARHDARVWQRLARAGDYRSALRVARSVRVGDRLERLSAEDALLLADAARLGGDPELAERAYLLLRERHPGSREATVAAFSLGRLAYDVAHDGPRAIEWFEAFLAESPAGDLAMGARARVMELCVSSGDLPRAAAVAGDYLHFHPSGPHAASAASLVQRAVGAPARVQ